MHDYVTGYGRGPLGDKPRRPRVKAFSTDPASAAFAAHIICSKNPSGGAAEYIIDTPPNHSSAFHG